MLPIQLHDEIQGKIDQGDEFIDGDDFETAIGLYQQALSLIPEPKSDYEISLPAFTALGEAYFYSGNDRNAIAAYHEALKSPGGVENPLLHLRLGQAFFENGDLDNAGDSLTRAYALDGKTIFDGEDNKYLSFLATRISL